MSGPKSVGALAGVTVVAMAAAVLLAFATIDAPPLPVKHRKAQAAAPAPVALLSTTAAVARAAAPAAPPPAPPPAPLPPKPAEPAPSNTVRPTATPGQPVDWATIATDELRTRASQNEIAAMEELGRRLLQGIDGPKDPQAGAGWLLRAAGLGSAPSAFNVGVMYERGFVVERDSSKAAEWYRKAADAGLPTAKHNLALLLRDGKGVPRDVKAATELLLSAARQGMAASMFSLGDIYEQGDGGTKDPSAALAWFAITGEFERQTNRDGESPLARTAAQRAQVLKRTLTTAELERAQALAQGEFKRIVADLSPPPAPVVASQPPAQIAPIDDTVLAWPKAAGDQVRAIQQALLDLKRIRDKPDGNLGPNTRTAIRDFQKSVGMKPTGEPSRDLYLALVSARHDIVSDSPLPTPPAPKVEPAKPQPVAAALAQPLNDTKIDLGRTDPPPPPPRSVDIAAAAPPAAKPPVADPPKPPPVVVDTTKPVPSKVETTQPSPAPADIATPPAPPPPTSADIAQAGPPKVEIAKVEIAKPDPNAWPAGRLDQVKAIQTLLRDLRFYNKAIDGQASGGTQAAIRDYQHMAGLKETGEADKALFESLKDMRKLMTPARN